MSDKNPETGATEARVVERRRRFTGRQIIWGSSLGLLTLGALLVATIFTGGDEQQGSQMRRPPASVRVTEVAPRHFASMIEAIGTARANESVVLTARVSDTVQRVNFDDGTLVKQGAILVELTNAEEVAQVREAEANVLEAEQQNKRVSDLVTRGTVSQATVDESVRALKAARSRLAAAEARAGDRIIRAPFAGILGLRNVSPGTLVSPGTQITTLDDISIIKVDFQVPERFIAALAPGQQIFAGAAAYPNREFDGTVKTVSSRVDPVTRAVTMRAEVANADGALRPGMLLTVHLISDERETLAVPATAIVPLAEDKFVYALNADNTVAMTKVEIGARQDGFVEVLAGLEAGQYVVHSGTLRLTDGAPVQVLNADEIGAQQPADSEPVAEPEVGEGKEAKAS